MNRISRYRIWTSLLALASLAGTSRACTLWAAVQASDGGTIISKNRDWKPDNTQVLKLKRSPNAYAYFGLYAEGNEAPGLKQGVNEKGLCVVTASASSIPKATRDAQTGKGGLMTALLEHYATCDAVLADQAKLFSHRHPEFLMVSDRQQVITLEIGVDGRYAVNVTKQGTVAHTNHFLDRSLADCNVAVGASSATRLKRIDELLKTAPGPLTAATFAAISQDHHDGPSNSLWRTAKSESTLSSWILETPADGVPTLRVLLANPGEPQQIKTYRLDPAFWAQS